ncbi:PEP/pyruvate-binding domain-containing protein [Nonomuraea sp. NPDC059007]|uniref:PEP/pyruvate-binding domain-containing protein n=1 Tax=Nonomuraea sp. NPDC059007 TaxID=3346692 RepID=UPI0036B0EF24
MLIRLAEIDSSMIDRVGGKAAVLGAMISSGVRVPDGFCLTAWAQRLPEADLVQAYDRLGGGKVAVRSSAIAHHPETGMPRQQSAYFNVEGAGPLLDAIGRCRESMRDQHATTCRPVREVAGAAMAVVVQRMIDPAAAGVIFTANPLTGCRTEMAIDAAPGLDTAIDKNTVMPEHHVLSHHVPAAQPDKGFLTQRQLEELRQAGLRLHQYIGTPQDIEWALDDKGVPWMLRSRPISALFSAPPAAGETHRPS